MGFLVSRFGDSGLGPKGLGLLGSFFFNALGH